MRGEATRIFEAFKPGEEMDDPHLFSGRRSEVLSLTEALWSPGSCPMILGDRGQG